MTTFEILFNSARPALWRQALLLNFGKREDAEDLMQECALAACANFERFDDRQPFEKWALCLLHNLHKNALRTIDREPAMAIGLMDEEPFERTDPSAITENCFAICDAVDRMPKEQRLCIMRIVEGEPADRTELTVRWRAKAALKELLT